MSDIQHPTVLPYWLFEHLAALLDQNGPDGESPWWEFVRAHHGLLALDPPTQDFEIDPEPFLNQVGRLIWKPRELRGVPAPWADHPAAVVRHAAYRRMFTGALADAIVDDQFEHWHMRGLGMIFENSIEELVPAAARAIWFDLMGLDTGGRFDLEVPYYLPGYTSTELTHYMERLHRQRISSDTSVERWMVARGVRYAYDPLQRHDRVFNPDTLEHAEQMMNAGLHYDVRRP